MGEGHSPFLHPRQEAPTQLNSVLQQPGVGKSLPSPRGHPCRDHNPVPVRLGCPELRSPGTRLVQAGWQPLTPLPRRASIHASYPRAGEGEKRAFWSNSCWGRAGVTQGWSCSSGEVLMPSSSAAATRPHLGDLSASSTALGTIVTPWSLL